MDIHYSKIHKWFDRPKEFTFISWVWFKIYKLPKIKRETAMFDINLEKLITILDEEKVDGVEVT
jgi:hypothetical protein